MPDQSEVEAGLAAAAVGFLYPAGVDAGSVVGVDCRVFPGWPVTAAVERDLAGGVAQVAVRAMPEVAKDRTRYPVELSVTRVGVPGLGVVVSQDGVTFAGVGGVGQVAGVRVDGRSYAYRVQAADTAEVVAAVLAAQVRVDRPALSSGASLELPGGVGVVGRVVADGGGGVEFRRVEMGFRVGIWAPSVVARDRIGGVVEAGLAGVTFLDVGGWGCRVRLARGTVSDGLGVAGVWRRDVGVLVEFPTTSEEVLPSMLFGVGVLDGVALVV